MDFELKGRKALVTGASQGIGRTLARLLPQQGVRVAAAARRADELEALAAEAPAGSVIPLYYDLYQEGAPAKLAEEASAALGHIDILMNVAGGTRPFPTDASPEQWSEAMVLNFFRPRELAHAVVDGMRERKWGRIVNFTGTSEPLDLNGAASGKAATHAWAKGLSRIVAPDGVTINSIQPGRIHSEQIGKKYPTPEKEQAFAKQYIPIGRFGEPEEIAIVAMFLASPLARYVTGAVIPVDGGLRLFAF